MNTSGTESPLANPSTHSFTAQLAPTGGAHADVQIGAIHGPDIGPQGGGDVWNAFTPGMGTEMERGAASKSSAPDAHIDGPMATLDMRMGSNRDIELASFFSSPSPLDLNVAAAGAGDALRCAIIQYRSHVSS